MTDKTSTPTTRRTFLTTSAAATAAGLAAPYFFSTERVAADEAKAKNDRLRFGCIGNGGMGHGDAGAARRYGDIVAVCDVDRGHAESVRQKFSGGKAEVYEDYRKLLDRKDIDAVTISTPDHWHTRILIDALKAGKDAYCQKPLTLTIDEGKQICAVAKQTGRVVQVGTQQRSENHNMFLKAVALCHAGRLGKIKKVSCAIGGAPSGGPFKKSDPPSNFNWDMWLGQAPKVDFIRERTHNHFRWWYEYSGGKMTDWGAHHVDIAQWAIGMDQSGPKSIEVVSVTHPVKLKEGMPTADDRFNTATAFQVRCLFPNDVEMIIRHDTDNGVLIEGENGRIFVNRGKLVGKAVDDMKSDPLPDDALTKLRHGKPLDSHMGNFVACVKDRSLPVSDVYTHHRALTTCHLANIALRLGRNLNWDAQSEQIVGDDAANAWQKREQRQGFEIVA